MWQATKGDGWYPLVRVLQEARPHAAALVGGALLLCAASLVKLRLPAALGQYIELLQTGDPGEAGGGEDLWELVVWMLALMCMTAVLQACNRLLLGWAGVRLVERTRARLFSALITSSLGYHGSHTTGELTQQLGNDVANIKASVCDHLPELVQHAMTLAGGLSAMASISLELTVIGLALGPLIGAVSSRVGWRVRRLDRHQDKVNGEASSIATESLVAIATIKSFRQESAFIRRHSEKVTEAATLAIKAKVMRELWKGSVLAASSVAVAIALFRGGRAVVAGQLAAGSLFSFVHYAILVGSSVSEASDSYTRLMSASQRAALAFQSLDNTTKQVKGNSAIALEGHIPTNFDVEFEDVSFRYNAHSPTVLNRVRFSLAAGTTTAIVGLSGGGKSTILRLLLRLYQPCHDVSTASAESGCGVIRIGGHPLNEIGESWLRANVAMVSQTPILFRGTIADNIALGAPPGLSGDALMDRIVSAAKGANAHEFIIARGGYETEVDERGSDLSGGEQQRIAIARVLLVNPRIILLDEATSALDAESESVVTEALQRALQGRTAIVVAHRLATVQNSDLILVLDQGQIAETGKHTTLMDSGGLYCKLYDMLKSSADRD